MDALRWLVDTVIEIYIILMIALAVMSWLVAFDVVNRRNRFVWSVGQFLQRVTEPVLRPLRRIVPNIGGMDLTPVIFVLLLLFVQKLLNQYVW